MTEAAFDGTSERVLVTGASGFIGKALVDLLLAEGHEVFALVRPGAPQPPGVPRLTTLPGDLRSDDDLQRAVAVASPSLSFHLAWRAEPIEYITSIPWNFQSIRFGLALVEALLEGGCRRIVCAGSCAEYELGPKRLQEGSRTRPGTLYGAAKLALGTAVTPAAYESGASLTWARIFYVYGPHEDPRRAVPRIVNEALGGQSAPEHSRQHRDFLYVSDVASALSTLGRRGVHGPVNVCSGKATSLHEISSIVLGIVSDHEAVAPDGNDDDSPPIVGDASVLAELGWQPRIDLPTGLKKTVAWWKEEGKPT